MADDYLDPRVNVVSSDADVERTLASDKREGRKAPAADGPLDQQYVDAIKGFEGFTPRAQWDVNNHRNGYGTNALYPTETIDKDEAHRRLTNELGSASALVDGQFPGLPAGHRAALTSLTFNAGPGWMGQGLGNAVRNGDWDKAKQLFLGYNHSAGSVNAGLTKRRAAEAAWLDGASPGPMDAALNNGDVTGSVPQGRRQMPSPMDEASSPGILDRLTQNIQNHDRVTDALGNAGAWLIARDNPAGGAALLAGLKKDKNTGEWSHQIDTNTGQIISVHNKTGQVRTMPIPGYNTNKAADEARLKEEGKADVELDTKLGEYGATLGSKRADLNEALKTFKDLPEAGLWNTDQGIAAQRLARSLNIPGFDTLPQVEKARAIAERLALQANTANGMRLLPGSESNSDRQKLEQMQANPVNTKAANMELLGIAERGLKRDEDAYKIHQGMTGSGFNRKAYYAAIEANDKKRAAEQAEAAAAQPAPGAPLQLPKGVKSIQLIQ